MPVIILGSRPSALGHMTLRWMLLCVSLVAPGALIHKTNFVLVQVRYKIVQRQCHVVALSSVETYIA